LAGRRKHVCTSCSEKEGGPSLPMPVQWTPEQVLALAPDDKSAKAGQGLATPRQWVSLGCDEIAAWGECQGSGAKPYQTQVELSEPAFKCTCPSRKFPCKHGLGLLLLVAGGSPAVTEREPPEWVTQWLAERAQREEKREQKREQQEERAPDEAARAKRAADREAKVAAGLVEMELWLRDLIRTGLAGVQGKPYGFWEATAARMVDAQAPGVGRMIQELSAVAASGDGWQERLLQSLARLYLLREAYERLSALPDDAQADVRAAIGWAQSQEEVLAQAGVRDEWVVLGARLEEEARLRLRRTWLWGKESNRAALLLDFAAGSQPLEPGPPPGVCFEAELAFYPGAFPLRALVKARYGDTRRAHAMPGHDSAAVAMVAYGAALARSPWLERFPLPLCRVKPLRRDDGWIVVDEEGDALPLSRTFREGWQLLSVSGGHPLAVFGEWDGAALWPMSAWEHGSEDNPVWQG